MTSYVFQAPITPTPWPVQDPTPWLRFHPDLGAMGRFASRFEGDSANGYCMKWAPRAHDT